ncbi:MutS-related protein [Jiangella anatolica]|uniref:DNA mismatch repair protein n=1 Tax=Jiangella anatolica TaxID=2670374 RepID=A0A2W2C027_9ACTN|nr:DNA mismatch repair protein [Jiangella anatolica]PZF86074.1 DNA mismatch repair protein [Jiangella anatolica]
MKVFLLHPDREVEAQEPPPQADALVADLDVDTLIGAMAGGDRYLWDVAKQTLLASLTGPDTITYRQRVLADCLDHPGVVRKLYDVAVEAIEARRKVFYVTRHDTPERVVSRSVQMLTALMGSVRRLRALADDHATAFRSEGFTGLFARIADELDDDYLAAAGEHLAELDFRRGTLFSGELGRGNRGVSYVLHRLPRRRWFDVVSGRGGPRYSFQIPDRDEAGFQALGEIRSKGLNEAANAIGQDADHVVSFFTVLRFELAFYLGCVNLRDQLAAHGEPVCFPTPVRQGEDAFTTRGLYDVCLALRTDGVVGNDVDADGSTLVMVTGANQGGKSTFLRSVGLAQLMMQCGLFVAATQLRATVAQGVFTHFKREEDATMTHGKFDEELARMSDIADQITPGALLLCNESFGSTNEREGSQIARDVIDAMTGNDIRVVFVTHLFDLAHGLHEHRAPTTVFLRAERRPDETRTFRVVPGEPLPTSYGEDSYRRIFGTDAATAVSA